MRRRRRYWGPWSPANRLSTLHVSRRFHAGWAPVEAVLVLALLYREIGLSAFVGFGVLMLSVDRVMDGH